jgi:WD40 repeat protein
MLPEYIKPTLLIPQHRLATLLEQAKSYQRLNCVFHTADAAVSLLADCNCDPATFPSITTNILQGHTDEIWRLEFSHGGDRLATAGRDKTAIIWNVKVSSPLCGATGY